MRQGQHDCATRLAWKNHERGTKAQIKEARRRFRAYESEDKRKENRKPLTILETCFSKMFEACLAKEMDRIAVERVMGATNVYGLHQEAELRILLERDEDEGKDGYNFKFLDNLHECIQQNDTLQMMGHTEKYDLPAIGDENIHSSHLRAMLEANKKFEDSATIAQNQQNVSRDEKLDSLQEEEEDDDDGDGQPSAMIVEEPGSPEPDPPMAAAVEGNGDATSSQRMDAGWLSLFTDGTFGISIVRIYLAMTDDTEILIPINKETMKTFRERISTELFGKIAEMVSSQHPGVRAAACLSCGHEGRAATCSDCFFKQLCLACMMDHNYMAPIYVCCHKVIIGEEHVCPTCESSKLCRFCLKTHKCEAHPEAYALTPYHGRDQDYARIRAGEGEDSHQGWGIGHAQLLQVPEQAHDPGLPEALLHDLSTSSGANKHEGLDGIVDGDAWTLAMTGGPGRLTDTKVPRWCQCCQFYGAFSPGDYRMCDVQWSTRHSDGGTGSEVLRETVVGTGTGSAAEAGTD